MMRRVFMAAALAALLLAAASLAWGAELSGWHGKVLKVVDGDSLVLQGPDGKQVQVRLWGVDCPELDQPWGDQALRYSRTLQGASVLVRPKYTDRHGRVVGQVFNSMKMDHAVQLLRRGLAWWYMDYAKDCDQYANAWWGSLKAERGIFSDPKPQMPPWQWRRIHRR